jgi:CheY-like chemotaxis protein/anti-sigma regulatory factor (Ser/Thr protein kinase)
MNVSLKSLSTIKNIVKDLKGFGRKEDGEKLINVKDVIDSSINLTHSQFKHIAKVKTIYADNIPDLLLQPDRIEQVLINLLINASQAFDHPENYDNNIITITTQLENNTLTIDVSDTGKGIPENLINSIFEPFFTTKPAGVGTGLGLSISKSIIESIGGMISVKSTINNGTTFTLTLPIKIKMSDLSEEDKTLLETLNIMIIDSDYVIANMLSHSMNHTHNLIIPTDGKDAIRLLKSKQISPDIIISDLSMPDINGIDIYNMFENENNELKDRIIFMIDSIDKQSYEYFIKSVSNCFLEKPCTMQTLINSMKQVFSSN